MPCLADTNVLLRLSQGSHPMKQIALDAAAKLRARNEPLRLARQSLIEFREMATRPTQNNGFGLSAANADDLLTQLEQSYTVLPDADDIDITRRSLVSESGVMGKQVHDARPVAAMRAYNVTHLLTFNVGDFARFQALPPGPGASVTVVHSLTI